MASSALSARLCAPSCSSSRTRATSVRRAPSSTRRRRDPCRSSLGDASFPFLPPKKKGNGVGDEDDDEGPSLVPLDPDSTSLLSSSENNQQEEGYDSDGLFGPLALLAVGIAPEALRALADLLENDLGARGVVPSFAAAEAMLPLDLCSAFERALAAGDELCLFNNKSGTDAAAPRSSVARPAVVLSGMSSPEVVSIVSAWQEAAAAAAAASASSSPDLDEVLFCAAVPANWRGRTLRQLVEDIAGDAAAVEGRGRRREGK